MKIRLTSSQIQKQILAPQMRQSIEVLLLPLTELSAAIETELQNNPLLEVNEEEPLEATMSLDEPLFDQSLPSSSFEHNEEDQWEKWPIADEITLAEHLLKQLRMEFQDPHKIKIGEFIIGNLDEDGYLKCPIEEMARLIPADPDVIVEVMKVIHKFEPVGIASLDLKGCLLTQLDSRDFKEVDLPYQIIDRFFEELGRKNTPLLARKLGVSPEKIKEALTIISTLEPKPARNFYPILPNIYIRPDITIVKDDESLYQITINHDGLPRLQINTYYKRLLQTKHLNEEERNFIRERLKNAQSFIKSIHLRKQTMREIASFILERQKNFFENGHMEIAPMNLKDVAGAVNRNESTISRAISNKYIDTPQGIFPLKYFFTQAVNENGNISISSRSVKEEIRRLIEDEDKTNPQSDQDILQYFHSQGIQLARRTIAKYRKELGIFPSHLRRN